MTADQAAAYLAEIAYHLRHREDHHRARAFSKVAAVLLRDRPDLVRLERAGRLESIEGVGSGIAKVLGELVANERSDYLDRLREESGAHGVFEPVVTPLVEQGYQGDLHVHSDWSDGGASVLDMALAAKARGYRYLAITDHSPRITVVNGLGPERLIAQRQVIEDAQRELGDGLRILQGIEVDILPDGSLDLPDDALAALDVVVASPHLQLRMERGQMTERMLRAVENPNVDIVGHPTGRRPGSRQGADYDFERVFRVAAERGVRMEIDCDPARMDLSPELAALALECGCGFSLDSDAHYTDQFVYVDLALWVTRRAAIPTEKILNWLPVERLEEVLNARG
jgi:putative hydrolase